MDIDSYEVRAEVRLLSGTDFVEVTSRSLNQGMWRVSSIWLSEDFAPDRLRTFHLSLLGLACFLVPTLKSYQGVLLIYLGVTLAHVTQLQPVLSLSLTPNNTCHPHHDRQTPPPVIGLGAIMALQHHRKRSV